MYWKDEGYLLSKTNFDENSIIINAFTINHGKYLMTLARHEGRRMKALALLRYNGSKEISDGEILFLPLSNNNLKEFKVKKCRVEMTEHAKIINKLTVKRR